MKKLYKIIIMILMVAALIPANGINAADGGVSISGPSELAPGASGTYTISFHADDTAYFQYSISGANMSVSGSGMLGEGEAKSAQVNVTATAGSEGTGTITANVTIATTGKSVTEFTRSASKNVNIAKPAPTPPSVTPPSVTPPTQKPTPPPAKTPEQIAKEQAAAKEAEAEAAKAREEAEKAAEEAAKELAQKTPLISTIEVVSMSDKRNNQSVNVTETAHDTWDYEYSLPKRIDKFRLSVLGVDEDVTLTYDENHEFVEGDEPVKAISIRAVKDDIVQEFTYKITKDQSVTAIFEVSGEQISIFEDDLLDEMMVASGFVRGTYKGSNDTDLSYFSFGDINVQLILNKDNELQWHLLSEDNVIGEPVGIVFDAEKNPFFVMEAPLEMAELEFRGNPYKFVEGKVEETLHNLDSSVKWQNRYKAWSYDDAQLVYGMTKSGEVDTYRHVPDVSTDLAVVAFDAQSDGSTKTVAIASSAGLVSLSGYILFNTITNIRKRKEY